MTDIKQILKQARRAAYGVLQPGQYDLWMDDVAQDVAIDHWLYECKGGNRFNGNLSAMYSARKINGSKRTHDKKEFQRAMRRAYVPSFSDYTDPQDPMLSLAKARLERKGPGMSEEQREALRQAAGVELGSEIARRRGVTCQAVSMNKREALDAINRK